MAKEKVKKICSVAECGKPHKAKGFCQMHYAHHRVAQASVCLTKGCEDNSYSRGHCRYHYDQILLTQGPIPDSERFCTVDGCHKKLNARGCCKKHYRELLLIEGPLPITELCSMEGCGRPHKAKGMCAKHFDKYCTPFPKKFCSTEGCGVKHFGRGFCRNHYNVDKRRREPEKDRSYKQKYIDSDPERHKHIMWEANLKRQYGVTAEYYYALLEAQGGACSICRTMVGTADRKLDVDHCHDTGTVRGLLCRSCNLTVGYMKNSPEMFLRASRYVERNGNPRII